MLIKARDAECVSGMATAELRYMTLAHQDCEASLRAMNAARARTTTRLDNTAGTGVSHASSQMDTVVFAQRPAL